MVTQKEYSLEYIFLIFSKIKLFLEIAVYWTFQIAITPSYGASFLNRFRHQNQEDDIYPVTEDQHSFEHFEIWAIIKVLDQYLINWTRGMMTGVKYEYHGTIP